MKQSEFEKKDQFWYSIWQGRKTEHGKEAHRQDYLLLSFLVYLNEIRYYP